MRKLLFALTASVTLLAATAAVSVPDAAAAGPELKTNHPDRYTVVKGDTLWDISSRFLNNPWYWPEIWQVNPQIANPHLIYPGDNLALIYVDGKPRITKVSSGTPDDIGVTRLSPSVRSTPIDSPVPTIPLAAISGFLTNSRIVTQAELDSAAYVLAGLDGRVASGAGDRVYARGDVQGHGALGVFRPSQTFADPVTGEFLGMQAKSVGSGKVAAVKGDIVSLDLKQTSEEILQGDRLLPTDDAVINSQFSPSNPTLPIDGLMISVLDGVTQIGQYDVVVINKGERDGLEIGHVLAIFKKGRVVLDRVTNEQVELPAERAGLLMVFRAYEKLSYGLILTATRPLAIMDQVKNP